jgi:hypothetical protein
VLEQAAEAFFAGLERVDRTGAFERVPDGAFEGARIDFDLVEVIVGAVAERRALHVAIALRGQQDDRRGDIALAGGAEQLEAAGVSEAIVQEADVVLAAAERFERLRRRTGPVELEPRVGRAHQHLAHEQLILRIVVDEEDTDHLTRWRVRCDAGRLGQVGRTRSGRGTSTDSVSGRR